MNSLLDLNTWIFFYENINILLESAALEEKLHPDVLVQSAFKRPKRPRVSKRSAAILIKADAT